MFGKYGEFLSYFNVRVLLMKPLYTFAFVLGFFTSAFPQEFASLELMKTIYGNITPKSITSDGNGRFYAQNMMYSHTITVYDRSFKLVKTISDKIDLADYGFSEYDSTVSGSPVEATASHNGKYLWVTNYQMFGDGFDSPGSDRCKMSKDYDSSFVFKINTQTLKIESVAQVGCVPKYIAATPDNRYILVTNWCSGDLSVIDTDSCKEIRRIDIGLYPRGIAVDSKSRFAYIAVMGAKKIVRVDLRDFSKTTLYDTGSNPRHLCIDSQDKFLYATLNGESKVVKINLAQFAVVDSAQTETAPRSMAMSADDAFLYVVNYASNSLSVIRTDSMKTVQIIETGNHPIGVTYDTETKNVWVACYSGCIQIFKNAPSKKVPLEILATKEKPAVQKKTETKNNYNYHIIVGAFKEEANLKKMMSRCAKAGYEPYIINPAGTVKKLSCKGFEDKSSALLELDSVKEKFGASVWICRQPVQ